MRFNPVFSKLTCLLITGMTLFSFAAQAEGEAAVSDYSASFPIGTQARKKGDPSCKQYERGVNKPLIVCDYVYRELSLASLKRKILKVVYADSEPLDPSQAYVDINTNPGHLEFASTNPDDIKTITEILADSDTLADFVPRRKVAIDIQILQIKSGQDNQSGFNFGFEHAGHRVSANSGASALGSLMSVNFAFGNIANLLLKLVLQKYKDNNMSETVDHVQFPLTHDYNLSYVKPYSRSAYVIKNSSESSTEQEGITFQGLGQFFRDQQNKIMIRNFVANVTQRVSDEAVDPKSHIISGLETFASPMGDLELEIGCSTVIRVISQVVRATGRRSSLTGISKSQEKETKEFLFIVTADRDNMNTPASTSCVKSFELSENGQVK